jgi:hypothetical protein
LGELAANSPSGSQKSPWPCGKPRDCEGLPVALQQIPFSRTRGYSDQISVSA